MAKNCPEGETPLFSPELNPIFHFHLIDNVIEGYRRYRILLWALESGLADILYADGPQDPAFLIEKLGYQSVLGEFWVRALIETGILEKVDRKVRLCPEIAPYLVTKSPFYQGDSIRSCSEGIWGESVQLFKNQDVPQKPAGNMSSGFLKVVCQHSMRGEIQEITHFLGQIQEFQSSTTLLDIGGGHGMYSISLCQKNPGLSAVILDRADITPFTQEMIEKYQMNDCISVVTGDMNISLPGSLYDIVFASHVLYRTEDLLIMLNRIAEKIKPGGLVISNHKFEDDWIIPTDDSLKALNTSFIKKHHKMVTQTEFNRLLELSGFSVKNIYQINVCTGFSTLTIASKNPLY